MHSVKITPLNDVIFTDFNGREGILVDLNSKQYYRLNETGSIVWRGLEKGNTIEEIVSRIESTYEVSVEHARASVEELLRNLESNKLIKRE
ncbi:MAG TPA: PqqD family protein [Pyrinomonadaceae bacterium]|nr:PqqD family protein [Pyrinomonadaceae bacterium]